MCRKKNTKQHLLIKKKYDISLYTNKITLDSLQKKLNTHEKQLQNKNTV